MNFLVIAGNVNVFPAFTDSFWCYLRTGTAQRNCAYHIKINLMKEKHHWLRVKFSYDDFLTLKTRAKSDRTNYSEYIRTLVRETRLKENFSTQELQLLRDLSNLGNLLSSMEYSMDEEEESRIQSLILKIDQYLEKLVNNDC